MASSDESSDVVCRGCGTVVEICAFCERGDCPETICYRCLRIELVQSLPQPHVHGG